MVVTAVHERAFAVPDMLDARQVGLANSCSGRRTSVHCTLLLEVSQEIPAHIAGLGGDYDDTAVLLEAMARVVIGEEPVHV